MKLVILTLGVLISFSAFAGEPTRSVVDEEFDKTKAQFLKKYQDALQEVADLKKQKEEIVARLKEDVDYYDDAADELRKYDKLLMVRATDSQGKYEKRNEVAADDVKKLNMIFEKYIKATLLPDKVSVRYAREMVERAIDELEARVQTHSKPEEANSPELEILGKKIDDAKERVEQATAMAKRLGIEVTREVASQKN